MLIKQSQLTNTFNILDRLESLDEPIKYSINTINIRENARLNKYMIQLESFIDFAKNNAISDGGECISVLCKANKISPSQIAFVVNEENLFIDEDIIDTYKQLLESNIPVYISQMNKDNTYYTKLQNALIMDESTKANNLEIYCKNPINKRFNNNNINEAVFSLSKKHAAINKVLREKLNESKICNKFDKVKLNNEIKRLNESLNKIKYQIGNIFFN